MWTKSLLDSKIWIKYEEGASSDVVILLKFCYSRNNTPAQNNIIIYVRQRIVAPLPQKINGQVGLLDKKPE